MRLIKIFVTFLYSSLGCFFKMFLALILTVLIYNGVECALSSGSVNVGDCVCATTTVNGRAAAGLSASIVTSVSSGSCGKIYGGILTTDGYTWFEITYNGQRIWVAGKYFVKSSSSSCGGTSTGSTGGCPSIVSRSAWGARAPRSTSYMPTPASYAFIHHAESNDCFDQSSCAALVRSFQNYHMDSNGWSDIGYSFLIGGDGSVFEGRGWDHLGAHTGGHNSEGFGFCFIGSFMSKAPTDIQIAKAKQIIHCGVSKGKIKSAYTVRGHRDMGSTDCPGDVLYGLIRNWPHY